VSPNRYRARLVASSASPHGAYEFVETWPAAVMPALFAGIDVFACSKKTSMAGSSRDRTGHDERARTGPPSLEIRAPLL